MFLFLYSRLGFTAAQIFRLYYGRHPDPIVEVEVEVKNVTRETGTIASAAADGTAMLPEFSH